MRIVASSEIDLAAQAVEAGRLVIVPTSRWYMICCDASNTGACDRIFAAKQRPADKSLLLVAPSTDAVRQRFHLSADAKLVTDALWPGDLALLLPWRDPAEGTRHSAVGTPEALVTSAPGSLGALAQRVSRPLAATSANISGVTGSGPSISLDEVERFLAQSHADVPVVVDGGICPVGNHLTILRCADDRTELVREGVVHRRAVSAALGREIGR
jgi:L-threonylcarbamoyladenylate synthase